MLTISVLLSASGLQAQLFETLAAAGKPTARHEPAVAVVNHNLCLVGGRGKRPVDRLNLKSCSWDSVAPVPLEMHHFLAASYRQEIIIAGAFTGTCPHEKPFKEVYAFHTKNNTWHLETTVPAARLRGAAAFAICNSKLYLIAGIQDGHYDGYVKMAAHNQAEIFDTQTRQWHKTITLKQGRHGTQALGYKGKIYIAAGSANRGGGPELSSAEVC